MNRSHCQFSPFLGLLTEPCSISNLLMPMVNILCGKPIGRIIIGRKLTTYQVPIEQRVCSRDFCGLLEQILDMIAIDVYPRTFLVWLVELVIKADYLHYVSQFPHITGPPIIPQHHTGSSGQLWRLGFPVKLPNKMVSKFNDVLSTFS